jgi:hypothetical protein
VVASNRREGPAEILAIVEERAPHGFDNIETVISSAELARFRPAISVWPASTKPR